MLCPRYPGTLDLDRNPVVGERNISILEKAQSLILIVSPSNESGIEKCIPQRLLLESKESWMPLWMFFWDRIAASVFVDILVDFESDTNPNNNLMLRRANLVPLFDHCLFWRRYGGASPDDRSWKLISPVFVAILYRVFFSLVSRLKDLSTKKLL